MAAYSDKNAATAIGCCKDPWVAAKTIFEETLENAGMKSLPLIPKIFSTALFVFALTVSFAQQGIDRDSKVEYFALKDTLWENISNNKRFKETVVDAKRFVAMNDQFHFEPHYKPVRYLAMAYRNANLIDSCIWSMENMRTICELNNDTACISTLYFVYAGALMDKFYPDSALKVQLKLLEIRKRMRPKTQLVSLRDNIAYTLSAIEDYTASVEMYEAAYQEALDSLASKPSAEMESYFKSTIFLNRCNTAMANTQLGQLEKARENLENIAGDLATQNAYHKRMFFHAKGLLEAKVGYYQAATVNLEESLKYAQEVNNLRLIVVDIAHLLEVSMNGKLNASKIPKWISEGIEAQKQLANYGSNFYKLAAIYSEQQGDMANAFMYAKKSIEIIESRTPKDAKARMLFSDYEKSTLSEEHKQIYEKLVDSMDDDSSALLRYGLPVLLLAAIGTFAWRLRTRKKRGVDLSSTTASGQSN
jgi:tetratricopeptide (TPR) repeat protein